MLVNLFHAEQVSKAQRPQSDQLNYPDRYTLRLRVFDFAPFA